MHVTLVIYGGCSEDKLRTIMDNVVWDLELGSAFHTQLWNVIAWCVVLTDLSYH